MEEKTFFEITAVLFVVIVMSVFFVFAAHSKGGGYFVVSPVRGFHNLGQNCESDRDCGPNEICEGLNRLDEQKVCVQNYRPN